MIRGNYLDCIIDSIARYISGLKPKYGSRYFFEALHPRTVNCILRDVIDSIEMARKGHVCPFCGYRARRSATLVGHILSMHRRDIMLRVLRCAEVCRSGR